MLRIDFYAQHLLRHKALAIELTSGQPVLFRLASGERKSNQAIDHSQLVQLLQESAPAEAVEEFKRTGRASFEHRLDGVDLSVAMFSRGPEHWTIRISPESVAVAASVAAPVAAQSSVESPRASIPAAPSEPSPNVDAAPPAWERSTGLTGEPVLKRPAQQLSIPPPAVKLEAGEPRVNLFLRQMIEVGASDLHMSSDVAPMVRLHGEMQILENHSVMSGDELRNVLLEILPERLKRDFDDTWDADFAWEIKGLSRFRANYFMDRKGIGAVFRQIPFKILSADKLGISQHVLDLCWLTKGLVVVTGPTGSGKSTTLAALIDFINDHRSDHLITIEDPVEFVHPNKKCLVNQREIGVHTKSFKTALKAALREDPDIVLVGEMRDLETISIAIETAETGHLVFGTLHTTSAASTVDRIIDQFPTDRQSQVRVMLSESLRGVIAQVLCKKKGGGRVAAHEILIANPAVSNLIREGKTFQLASVMQTGKALGMQTMNDHLLRHVLDGVVEPEEAFMKANDKGTFKELLKKNNISLNM